MGQAQTANRHQDLIEKRQPEKEENQRIPSTHRMKGAQKRNRIGEGGRLGWLTTRKNIKRGETKKQQIELPENTAGKRGDNHMEGGTK